MKVLIVDDEAPARERLRQMIQDSGEHTVAGDAANGKQALEIAARVKPDVVLLDIRMPGLNGIETAQHLNAFDKPPAIVFTTAYDEYAIEAFEAQAIGYVLTPRYPRIEPLRFWSALTLSGSKPFLLTMQPSHSPMAMILAPPSCTRIFAAW